MKRTAPLAVVSWSLLAVLAQPLGSASPAPVPQLSPALDFEVFKTQVQPIFLAKRQGYTRCVVCQVVAQ